MNLFDYGESQQLPSAPTVGKSIRTPLKHSLFNSTLGQVTGVATTQMFKNKRLVILDLCAGDAAVAAEQDWTRSCSPGITAKHALFAANKGKRVMVFEHEKSTSTFSTLQQNLTMRLPEMGYTKATEHGDWFNYVQPGGPGGVQYHVQCIDSTLKTFNDIGANDIVFVLNDPNSIQTWAANSQSIDAMIERGALVTSLHTMGCNAGGVRRLKEHERVGWSLYVDDVLAQCERTGQACCLVSLDRDAHRWGYLVTYPVKWRPRLVQHVNRAAKQWQKGVSFAFADEPEFNQIRSYLLPDVPDLGSGDDHD